MKFTGYIMQGGALLNRILAQDCSLWGGLAMFVRTSKIQWCSGKVGSGGTEKT